MKGRAVRFDSGYTGTQLHFVISRVTSCEYPAVPDDAKHCGRCYGTFGNVGFPVEVWTHRKFLSAHTSVYETDAGLTKYGVSEWFAHLSHKEDGWDRYPVTLPRAARKRPPSVVRCVYADLVRRSHQAITHKLGVTFGWFERKPSTIDAVTEC